MKTLLLLLISFACYGQQDSNPHHPLWNEDDSTHLRNAFLKKYGGELDFIIRVNEDFSITELDGDTMAAIQYLVKELMKANNKVYEFERRKKP